ncbi:AI-2E family transporter [Alterisphingorhabdus coralli]|uniref:AI-2E family transporter n=1 Tax=Alterisphingorhabdus coralli TaxID=3071408 RepID=A0AA97F6B0_9SPHN|nr:AI-2E family transporter [Parasphingorhabdus sp. SCSIO 66989]WOE73902.1 AI-2E family transporter [Parasphingorhabdus sp. SCSIO 66989]
MDIQESQGESLERNRLLASVAVIGGTALLLGAPFALRAGSEFFLPLTVALILSIALVPLLEWLERHRIPSALAAFLCVIAFLVVANGALALIIVPATTWFINLPGRIPKITSNLQPLIDFYADAQRYLDETLQMMRTEAVAEVQKVTTDSPTSLIDVFISAAPAVGIQMVFAILVIFFFLAGWTRLRTGAINSRGSFTGAMATARVIQNVVSATSAYLTTITLINILLGVSVGFVLYLIGMESPAMWGGIVALLNFIPYLGPVLAAIMLALGGLMTFDDLTWALLPAIIQISFHTIEANLVTPMILGRRLTMNPLLILISLSFWSWIWGTLGALLAVPLLIIIQTIIAAAGKPDIAGFLFESGTLTRGHNGESRASSTSDADGKIQNAAETGKVTSDS